MKIVVTMDEIKIIVEKVLAAKGVNVVRWSGEVQSHTEGRYDEATQVTDGLSFELAEPVTPALAITKQYALDTIPYWHMDEIRAHLSNGNKTNAIKLARKLTGAGLKECKDYVDNM